MEGNIADLRNYLSQCECDGERGNSPSLLELLWDSYAQHNPINRQKIEGTLSQLRSMTNALPPEQQEALLVAVSDLSGEYERAAFQAGLRTGARLTLELMGQDR